MEKAFKKFDIAGRSDIEELNKRIDRLVEMMDEKKE